VTSPPAAPLIRVDDLSKFFGSVIALQDISLSVYAGEVMCRLGDNGAPLSPKRHITSPA